MTAADFISRLDAVRPRGAGRWSARCPAHDDRMPSLSVSEGERCILVRCWAGCRLGEIVGALGLTERDLFYDADAWADPVAAREAQYRREQERTRREREDLADCALLDARREADRLIQSACGLDVSGWSDVQLDAAMNALADAYVVLEREQREEGYLHG